MSATPRQASFAAGEISPSYWGRTDMERYAKGLRLCRDHFISKHGAVVSRPGTRFLGYCDTDLVDVGDELVPENVIAGRKPKLVTFYGTGMPGAANYVLEFVERGIRVWKGGLLLAGAGTIPTPYLSGQFYQLRWVQSGDVMYIACDGHPLAKLTRASDTAWTYEVVDFSRPAPTDNTTSTIVPYMEAATRVDADNSHPARPFSYVVTQLRRDADGKQFETGGVRVARVQWFQGDPWQDNLTYSSGDIVSKVVAGNLRFFDATANNNTNNDPAAAIGGDTSHWESADAGALFFDGTFYTAVSWSKFDVTHSYRGPDFTGVGAKVQAPSGAFYYAKRNLAAPTPNPDSDGGANWALYSPASRNNVLDADANVVRAVDKPVTLDVCQPGTLPSDTEYVSSRVYGGVAGEYGWLGEVTAESGSRKFVDYGEEPDLTQPPPQGTNPFEVKDAQGTVIRTEHPLCVGFFEDRLICGGTRERRATLFASAVGDYENFDQPFLPTAASALNEALAARQSQTIRSIIGKDKLFVLTNLSVWSFSGANGPLAFDNVEARVQVDVGAGFPQPIIVGNTVMWVRSQGTGVRAIEFDFSRGTYPGQDLSFFVDHLMSGHELVDICHSENPWGVTWCVREDGLMLSLTYCPDDQSWAWARHLVCLQEDGTKQRVLSICSVPEGGQDLVYMAVEDPNGGAAWMMRFSSRMELDDEATSALAGTGGGLEYGLGTGLGDGTAGIAASSGLVRPGTPICLDAWSVTTGFPSDAGGIFHFSGLTLYASRSVYVIADGVIYGPAVVASNGTLAIDTHTGAQQPGNTIWIGFGFLPMGQTLPWAEARTKQKVVNEVGLEVRASGKLKAGADFAHLFDKDMPDPAKDDMVRVAVAGTWQSGGMCVWRQVLPLPLTVRAVTRMVANGSL